MRWIVCLNLCEDGNILRSRIDILVFCPEFDPEEDQILHLSFREFKFDCIYSRDGYGSSLINTWLQPSGTRIKDVILKPFKMVSHFCLDRNHLAEARC
jgi:hypothetical protein